MPQLCIGQLPVNLSSKCELCLCYQDTCSEMSQSKPDSPVTSAVDNTGPPAPKKPCQPSTSTANRPRTPVTVVATSAPTVKSPATSPVVTSLLRDPVNDVNLNVSSVTVEDMRQLPLANHELSGYLGKYFTYDRYVIHFEALGAAMAV